MAISKWNSAAALDRVGHDRELLCQLIGIFIEDVPGLISQLRHQISESDFVEACRAAHSLKGLCMNFDAVECISLAENIEQRCRSNTAGDLSESLKNLSAATEALQEELINWSQAQNS